MSVVEKVKTLTALKESVRPGKSKKHRKKSEKRGKKSGKKQKPGTMDLLKKGFFARQKPEDLLPDLPKKKRMRKPTLAAIRGNVKAIAAINTFSTFQSLIAYCENIEGPLLTILGIRLRNFVYFSFNGISIVQVSSSKG